MRTAKETASELKSPDDVPLLPAPPYTGRFGVPCVMMAVESMRRHTADAGWQLQEGLEHAGYRLCGYKFDGSMIRTPEILEAHKPATLVLQDKREWEGRTAQQCIPEMRFKQVEALAGRDDIFKLTVLKDAQNDPGYHRDSADEIKAHGWIVYYHQDIIRRVAPYVRLEHCVRTTHSVEPKHIPRWRPPRRRKGCLVSGAVSSAYPLRMEILKRIHELDQCNAIAHPGYQHNCCMTPYYLQTLNKYKVAICTSSKYGYALRKIIEATACGCIVVTDLPTDDRLPIVEDNLVRVSAFHDIKRLLPELYKEYDENRQRVLALETAKYYDWRAVGKRLALKIEVLRQRYGR